MNTATLSLPASNDADACLVIKFPRAATVGTVEKLLGAELSEGATTELELDFAKSEFIEVATLILLVALITARKRNGLQTSIKLPDEKRTRDFLRLWSFPETIRIVTGVGFRRIASKKEDEDYFGENASPEQQSYASSYVIRDDGVRRLASTRFFSLQTYELTKGISKYVEEDNGDALQAGGHTKFVEQESGRWNGDVIRSVLAKQLQGPGGYVSSRIVFESMTNAIRHSKACFIVVGSMMEEPSATKKANSTGMFTLVYWDDGDSMIDTLKEALVAGKSIKSRSVALPPDGFQLQIEKGGEMISDEVVLSNFTPDKNTCDEKLLLATTFPGITRDVTAKGYASPELKRSHPEYDAPGMGLHVLLNTVIDVFGGSIGIRTKNHFMSIKKSVMPEKSRYIAKVRILPADTTSFVGNMLTIRLPVIRDKTQ